MPDRTILRPWPRGLREAEAADYIGVSTGLLRREVDEGRAPKPVKITSGRQVWLREDLDAYLDRLAGRQPASPARDLWQEAIDGGDGAAALRQHL